MYIHFQIIFTSLWGHFGVTLGSLWGHFGCHFGVILRSLWGQSGIILASFWRLSGPRGCPPARNRELAILFILTGEWEIVIGKKNEKPKWAFPPARPDPPEPLTPTR